MNMKQQLDLENYILDTTSEILFLSSPRAKISIEQVEFSRVTSSLDTKIEPHQNTKKWKQNTHKACSFAYNK